MSQPAASSALSSQEKEPLDPTDNFPLLGSACAVNRCMQQQDWTMLAAYVHPQRGVTFTPYSTVAPGSDLTFTADQIQGEDAGEDQKTFQNKASFRAA